MGLAISDNKIQYAIDDPGANDNPNRHTWNLKMILR